MQGKNEEPKPIYAASFVYLQNSELPPKSQNEICVK